MAGRRTCHQHLFFVQLLFRQTSQNKSLVLIFNFSFSIKHLPTDSSLLPCHRKCFNVVYNLNRMKKLSLSILFSLTILNGFPQDRLDSDSINQIIKKTFKGKSYKLTDMINDSSVRTFETYKKSKTALLACLKLNRDSLTIEKHFYYMGETLLKVSIAVWNWRNKTVSFDYFYLNSKTLKMIPLTEPYPETIVGELISTSKELLERFKTLSLK
jgi:hypothetical protein